MLYASEIFKIIKDPFCSSDIDLISLIGFFDPQLELLNDEKSCFSEVIPAHQKHALGILERRKLLQSVPRGFLEASWHNSRNFEISSCSVIFCVMEKCWPMTFSAPGNRFADLITPNWSYYLFLGSGSFSEHSVDWALRYSRLKARKLEIVC